MDGGRSVRRKPKNWPSSSKFRSICSSDIGRWAQGKRRENVYHGEGTLRRRRGNPAGLVLEGAECCGGRTGRESTAGLVLEGADGCGGRTGRESNRWQV